MEQFTENIYGRIAAKLELSSFSKDKVSLSSVLEAKIQC